MGYSAIMIWDIEKNAPTFKGGDNSCRLCLQEKLLILEYAGNKLLYKRNKLISKSRHVKKFLQSDLPSG